MEVRSLLQSVMINDTETDAMSIYGLSFSLVTMLGYDRHTRVPAAGKKYMCV